MWILFLIGLAVGVGLTLGVILLNYKVKDREWWEEQEREMATAHSCVKKAMAENARLRVALAAGEMTEDAKTVIAITMAAFEADIASAKEATN